MRYAELDGVIYRSKNIRGVEAWADKLEDGKWVPGKNHFTVLREAGVIDEDEAREMAGDQWPKESAPAA